jgi:hypothetical protein
VRTNAAGRWEFPILPPGLYSFVESQPPAYIDGREQNADPNGPPARVGNDRFDGVLLFSDPTRGPFNFGEIAANGSIRGSVYVDRNRNGRRDRGEVGIGGVTVRLTGTDLAGRTVNARVLTSASGMFSFRGLTPGTYQLVETHPRAYIDGRDRPGTARGVAGNDVIVGIRLGVNQRAIDYLFGEFGRRPGSITKNDFTVWGGRLPPRPNWGPGIVDVIYSLPPAQRRR